MKGEVFDFGEFPQHVVENINLAEGRYTRAKTRRDSSTETMAKAVAEGHAALADAGFSSNFEA